MNQIEKAEIAAAAIVRCLDAIEPEGVDEIVELASNVVNGRTDCGEREELLRLLGMLNDE